VGYPKLEFKKYPAACEQKQFTNDKIKIAFESCEVGEANSGIFYLFLLNFSLNQEKPDVLFYQLLIF